MIARLPGEVLAFYRRHPSLLVLAGEQTAAPDQEIATDFNNAIDLIDARFIAIHRGMMNANQLSAVDRLIGSNARLVRWITEDDLTVFRIARSAR